MLSIDPGGFELGVAFFEGGVLKATDTFYESDKDAQSRRKNHYRWLLPFLKEADLIICEEPFIRGAGNTNMQRMFGVFEWLTNFRIHFINPMTVKRLMAMGHEKHEVALGTLRHLTDPEKKIVERLIAEARWNETDAIAVALAWKMKQSEGTQMAGKAKKKTTKKGKGKKGC